MNKELAEQIQRVIVARRAADNDNAFLRELRSEFEKLNAPHIQRAKELSETILTEETTLRELALDEYERTKSKQIAPGVGIRVMQRLDYDPRDAFAWAKEHTMALALDKKRFEQIASVEDLNFVVKREEPIVTIASDLEAMQQQ